MLNADTASFLTSVAVRMSYISEVCSNFIKTFKANNKYLIKQTYFLLKEQIHINRDNVL